MQTLRTSSTSSQHTHTQKKLRLLPQMISAASEFGSAANLIIMYFMGFPDLIDLSK